MQNVLEPANDSSCCNFVCLRLERVVD